MFLYYVRLRCGRAMIRRDISCRYGARSANAETDAQAVGDVAVFLPESEGANLRLPLVGEKQRGY
jgi:hypothetical protein